MFTVKKSKTPKYKNKKFKHKMEYDIESFIKLIEFGDITDSYVTINNEIFNTGKSADYTDKKGFFDIEYYIDDLVFTSLLDYINHLKEMLSDHELVVKKIIVHEIDGGKPYNINVNR